MSSCDAGLNVRQQSLRSLDPADGDLVIAVNLRTAFNAIYFVLPAMRTRGSGLIVQTSTLVLAAIRKRIFPAICRQCLSGLA